MSPPSLQPPIGDYALLGNTLTAALVSREGSLDWLCWPRFDSPAQLSRLLDGARGGFLQVVPSQPFDARRAYVADTCVLETHFDTATGSVRLTDVMPVPRGAQDGVGQHWVLRRLEGLSGHVTLDVRFRPAFDYARADVQATPCPGGAVARDARGDASLVLVCPVPLQPTAAGVLTGRLHLRAGQRAWVVLAAGTQAQPGPLAVPEAALAHQLDATLAWWRRWAAACSYQGPYAAQVRRSALTLKLLTYAPTGALVAAPTTSLPEEPGGVRNWDYRYTWLRDASLTLFALQRVGYHAEAMAFWDWLERLELGPGRPPRIMYRVDGRMDLNEEVLAPLRGYRGARPVRIGNGAAGQTQLDIYGHVLDAAAFCQAEMGHALSERAWNTLRFLVDEAARRWREPDRGIWEVRGPPQHFLDSKLMCWVALDRGLRLAERTGRTADTEAWVRERDALSQAILTQGFHPRVGAFTQAFGSEALDASALRLPLVGFLPAADARVVSTVRAIQERLSSHGLVRRYHLEEGATGADGLSGTEGTFILCSFWLVRVLARLGRVQDAQALFERLLGLANDVGLLSEEVAPESRELLGNFPQGFSHLALIGSALELQQAVR